MSNYNDEKPKKRKASDRTIAFDKFELPEDQRPPKKERTLYEEMEQEDKSVSSGRVKKSDKISGRKQKSGFSKFAEAVLPQPDDSGKEKFRKIFLLAMIALLAGTLIYLGWQLFSIDEGGQLNSEIASIAGEPMSSVSSSYSVPSYIDEPTFSIVTTSSPKPEEPEVIDTTPLVNTPLNINFDALIEKNPDTRAWVKITGTTVNNVVVQGRDNSYYLTHDFNGNESVSGTIFATNKNTWDGNDDNTILFGHNMKNGDFFSYVVHYVPNDASSEPIAFYKVHPTIMMATPDGGSQTYKVFAGMICNTQPEYGEVFNYIDKTRFATADDFNRFIIDVMDRSWFFTDVDLTYGDEILTLSTCFWPLGRKVDTRWVILARKVRPGESEEVDVTKAYRNYQPKLFDYYYERLGTHWAGSVWDKKKLLSYSE
ncbi:MAG: class B sortase [Oscillospiraceae bacterium]